PSMTRASAHPHHTAHRPHLPAAAFCLPQTICSYFAATLQGKVRFGALTRRMLLSVMALIDLFGRLEVCERPRMIRSLCEPSAERQCALPQMGKHPRIRSSTMPSVLDTCTRIDNDGDVAPRELTQEHAPPCKARPGFWHTLVHRI